MAPRAPPARRQEDGGHAEHDELEGIELHVVEHVDVDGVVEVDRRLDVDRRIEVDRRLVDDEPASG